jgi:hypothetical protein
VAPTPQPSVLAPQNTPPSLKQKNRLGKLVLTILVIVILFTGTFTYLVAYEKVALKNTELQTKIAGFVMSVPFTPKTPRYVLVKAATAQSKLTSANFDLSVAVDSNTLGDIVPGVTLPTSFDFQVTGDSEFVDETHANGRINLSITKDFNADLLVLYPKIYFKINKVDGLARSLVTSFSQPDFGFLNNWFHYDITPLTTSARENLNTRENVAPVEKYSLDTLKLLTDDAVLSNIEMTREVFEGTSVYRLAISFTPNVIDRIPEILSDRPSTPSSRKASDMYKNAELALLVDATNFYIRKLDTTFDIVVPQSNANPTTNPFLSTDQTVAVSISSKLSNINESFDYTAPTYSRDYTELFLYFQPQLSAEGAEIE